MADYTTLESQMKELRKALATLEAELTALDKKVADILQSKKIIPTTAIVFHGYAEYRGTGSEGAPSPAGAAVFMMSEGENELKVL
ncbi:hypothetical protein TSUD_283620 [Trifolium subterraneum]|uniref:Uncharacterized protein n=1 Tax=Trifolium subterraneum TaxID=3900 RepID=A0A2Z6NE25_TRISU|nr:hypothetical protein TSUD_283620 [Trifolium subterraneum]